MTRIAPHDDNLDEARIFQEITGTPAIFVPVVSARVQPPEASGPALTVLVGQQDLDGSGSDLAPYWELIRSLPVRGSLGALSGINNFLDLADGRNRTAQSQLEERFVNSQLRARLSQIRGTGRPAGLFSRIGALLAISHMIAFGDTGIEAPDDEAKRQRIGDLFLYGNDLLVGTPSAPTTDIEIAAGSVPTWDLLNPGDLAYNMARTRAVLDCVQEKWGAALPLIDGLSPSDFRAIVFAILAWVKKNYDQGQLSGYFDRRDLLKEFPNAQPALERLISGRSLGLDEFRAELGGSAQSPKEFAARVRATRFLDARPSNVGGINTFYKHPLLRLDDDRVAVLDTALIQMLLARGIYWSIFDALPKHERKKFKDVWGTCFEVYIIAMLAHFFPESSRRMMPNVRYCVNDGKNIWKGEVDAILDYGDYTLLIEIKSALLTEPAKHGGVLAELQADIDRKFVQDGNKPLAVIQLARAANAVRLGGLKLANQSARLYPVIVTDEISASAPGFNGYLDSRFHEQALPSGVAPITVMSAVELEELLPYLDTGTIHLDDLLASRYTRDGKVKSFTSVHQALYDARAGGAPIRNEFLLGLHARLKDEIHSLFGVAPGGH